MHADQWSPTRATLAALAWSPPMPQEVRTFSKAAWLFLGNNAGLWTAAEIIARVKVEGCCRKAKEANLSSMASRGQITRRRGEDGKTRYGLTARNHPPRGVALHEMDGMILLHFIEESVCVPVSIA